MSARRARARRLALPALCAAAALGLHKGFCEWRTTEYAAGGDAASQEALLLLPVRTVRHASGNAERWDREEEALRAYDRAWLACHRELHGAPAPGSELARCLAARRYPVIGATAEAVALAECERERHGGVREPAALASCLRARGYPRAPVPRWAFERIGLRFEGPYVTRSGLFAEDRLASPAASRLAALSGGVVIPLALGALAVGGALAARAAGGR